ncbi:MAG: 50S ribosomal protein L10 [Pseudomonadota bacterium]
MKRAEKDQKIADLRDAFAGAEALVLTHQEGLTVAESTDLRRQMREAGASFRVTKNRLAKIAIEGTLFEGLSDQFTGPTAVAFSNDPVSAAKVAAKFAKDNDKLTIVAGALGDQVLDVAGVEALAKLPSLDELRAKIIGMLNTPATKVAGVVQAPAGQLARVVGAHANQGEAA